MSHDARPMSIDAMLDMERREVLALLENSSQTNSSPEIERRSASPYQTPRSPVRSMLDIDEEPSTSSRPTSPHRQAPVRSMLDTGAPLHRTGSNTTPNSPVLTSDAGAKVRSPSQSSYNRGKSEGAYKAAGLDSRRSGSANHNDPASGYQFSGIYNTLGGAHQQQMPLRAGQGSGFGQSRSGSLAEALRSSDLSSLQLPGESGRSSSRGGRQNKSKSPSNRLSSRSRSPATFSQALPPGKGYLNDGQVFDMNNAYRRLSDANLVYSSGSLAQLPMRKQSVDPGEGRLVKDYLGPDGEHLGSSEEDEPYSTDDESRGRKKEPRALNPDAKGEKHLSESRSRSGGRKTLSLLAAAEAERESQRAARLYQYRSLIPDPEIKVTNASGDTVKPGKHSVHPHTSFDHTPGSATASVMDSDEEADFDEIRRAQKLSFTMTNIISNAEAHRAVRIIYRGEYNRIAQTADEESRRLRKYMVATDLSDESTHALEWAIGTVLRDGDTLIAIYCVDEETGIPGGDGVSDDSKTTREQAAAVNTITSSKSAPGGLLFRGESTANTPGASPAPSTRGENKAEEDRHRAAKDITDRVLRLLRKTQLQVRVVVEVMHCKNPKHLITEVIDLVDPTLVVIGSRGRSALKGVILGSFSNYLVTKSSVPVMVARKRLRKQSKYKRTAVRQVNNLHNPAARSLANAKID
ncbi:Usp family protein [Emericellopsis atlantica]|uniref:Usp family protein n=1 Tax=Emericellopsis atlantica TaxID=2614577 RepID=A0A9P7ZM53_9HYPO|nr:Usp family protein [Emericellopsis atlantica]KAG9254649.1 Usp family protein [Emericellopsis atlantica]